MWTKSRSSLLALIVAAAFARPAAAQATRTCEFTRSEPIPTSSTLEEQFKCYKDARRKVSVPGTTLTYGGVNGAGCIVSIAADRVQIATCTGFTEKSITIPFASIRLVVEEEGKDYVTVTLRE